MVEVAPPYQRNAMDSRRFVKGLPEVVDEAMNRGLIQKFGAFMPDREYSEKGRARVLLFRRPGDGAFSSFEKDDLLVPLDDLAPTVEALLSGGEFPEGYRSGSADVRDVFVCTHNNRDVCCGKFGDPVYKELRRTYADETLRVWRTSHIGGHRFAPTLLELPEGRYWGHLEMDAVEKLVLRNGSFSDLGRFYRGWAGLGSKFEQIVEREILVREGWTWAGYLKEGRVLGVSGDEDRAEVRIEYEHPNGSTGAYEALVVADGSVTTLGNSGFGPLEEVTQYRVSQLKKVS